MATARDQPPSDELDEITLRRAQRGDEAACRALVERYQGPVFALISRMLGGPRGHRVEDVAQETFLHVFRNLGGFAPLGPARLSTWVLTIATRRAIDELRRPHLVAPPLLDEVVADRAPSAAERATVGQAVAQAVAALSPDHRAAFLLREVHGLEYAEIARALAVDVGTVKSRLARARTALRAALSEVHDG
ncbi:MAG: RNA polymerase sigma factor [Kofleriaceae bacterium]